MKMILFGINRGLNDKTKLVNKILKNIVLA